MTFYCSNLVRTTSTRPTIVTWRLRFASPTRVLPLPPHASPLTSTLDAHSLCTTDLSAYPAHLVSDCKVRNRDGSDTSRVCRRSWWTSPSFGAWRTASSICTPTVRSAVAAEVTLPLLVVLRREAATRISGRIQVQGAAGTLSTAALLQDFSRRDAPRATACCSTRWGPRRQC